MKLFSNKKAALLPAVILFTTSAFAQTIYTQNFEGSNSLPAGWSQATKATDGGWKVGTSATLSSHYFTFPSHTNFIATNDDSCECDKDTDLLKTGFIDLRNYSSLYLSFDSYYYGGSDNTGHSESATVKVSTDSGATWKTLSTIAGNVYTVWRTRYVDLSSVAGDSSVMIGFDYSDGGGNLYGWGIDNVQIFVPNTEDLDVIEVYPYTGSFASYGMPGAGVTVSFVVFNNSSSTVTSFNASCIVDGVAQTQKVYASLAPYTYDTTSFFNPYIISSAGDHKVTVVANIANDVNLLNDTAYTTVGGGTFSPTHTLVLEEGTGDWCGNCPAGAVAMDSISHMYPGNPALISVHDDLGYPGEDAMAFFEYDYGMAAYVIGGYPCIAADRKSIYYPAPYVYPAFQSYPDHINDFGIADISSQVNYDATTRKCTVTGAVKFAVNTLGSSAQLACVFTEDGVHGTTSDYNQNNYFSKNVENYPLTGAGHNWEQEPAYVPAARMYYDFVARAIVGGFFGTSVFPTNVVANTSYNYSFDYTIPAGYNESNMKAIVMLINPNTDEIFNASAPQTVTGINDIKSDVDQLSLYPNPAASELNVLFNLLNPQPVVFEITDIMGRQVASIPYGTLSASNHFVQVPTDNLASGIYMLNIKTGSGIVSRKFVKE